MSQNAVSQYPFPGYVALLSAWSPYVMIKIRSEQGRTPHSDMLIRNKIQIKSVKKTNKLHKREFERKEKTEKLNLKLFSQT
jgi:hypothetical protein